MDFKLKKSNLNFKVYTVTTKPTTAGAENDIAIISSVPMPNWILSPDGPSGIPRSDGDVWIQYSVSGNTFNAIKQNSMMIATISAWQYVDGAWVDREAVSCQNGEWVDWIKYLYNNGDTCDSVTGGWKTVGLATLGADCIELAPTSTTRYADACTNEKIDLSSCSKVLFKLSGYVGAGGGGTNVIVWVHGTQILENKIVPSASYAAGVTINTSTQLEDLGYIEVKAESLDGEYYVGVHAGLGGSSSADRIDDVKLLEVRYE